MRNVLTSSLLTSNLCLNDLIFIFLFLYSFFFAHCLIIASNTSNWTIIWFAIWWCTTWYASGNAWCCRDYEYLWCKYFLYYIFRGIFFTNAVQSTVMVLALLWTCTKVAKLTQRNEVYVWFGFGVYVLQNACVVNMR